MEVFHAALFPANDGQGGGGVSRGGGLASSRGTQTQAKTPRSTGIFKRRLTPKTVVLEGYLPAQIQLEWGEKNQQFV